jgi:hypothetical protein
VHLAGCTAHPDAEWVTQQAWQVTWMIGERSLPVRFLIRDHDRKFTDGFDAVFEPQDARIVRTPIQVPETNGQMAGQRSNVGPSATDGGETTRPVWAGSFTNIGVRREPDRVFPSMRRVFVKSLADIECS